MPILNTTLLFIRVSDRRYNAIWTVGEFQSAADETHQLLKSSLIYLSFFLVNITQGPVLSVFSSFRRVQTFDLVNVQFEFEMNLLTFALFWKRNEIKFCGSWCMTLVHLYSIS